MIPARITVLVVEDDETLRGVLVSALRGEPRLEVLVAPGVAAAEALVSGPRPIDVVLTDVRMPDGSGLELAARCRSLRPDVPVIVMTGFSDVETAIGALRSGAHDFIQKPFQLDDLLLRLRRAAEWRTRKREAPAPRARPSGRVFESMLGASAVMENVFTTIEQVAASTASVMILGETGTGKELVARALHARGLSPEGPFVAVNCAAVTETLLEAELFGHAKGAFTDARSARQGLFVAASGGTLFLDEIAEMPIGLQAKMLRALEHRTVRPVGSDEEVPFDARIVSATHRDLEARMADGRFREDLFYRLDVIEIHVPPLRERGADVLLLAQDFLERFARRSGRSVRGLDPACARCLSDYSWPGNVRELANVVERAVALARGEMLGAADLPEKITRASSTPASTPVADPGELVALAEVERRHVLSVLAQCGGHRARAAEVLGIDRKTLYAKLKQYGVPGAGETPSEG